MLILLFLFPSEFKKSLIYLLSLNKSKWLLILKKKKYSNTITDSSKIWHKTSLCKMGEYKDALIGAVVCFLLGLLIMLLALFKISMEYSLETIGIMEWVLALEWGVELTGCRILNVLHNISEPSFFNL